MASVKPKRKPQPRLDQLLDICNAESEILDKLVNFTIDDIEHDPDSLKKHICDLKLGIRKFNSICHDTICALFKYGSVNEAKDLKDLKTDKKQEVKELIACALGYLDALGDSDEISTLHSETSSVYDCYERDFSETNDPSVINKSPSKFNSPFLNLKNLSDKFNDSLVLGNKHRPNDSILSSDFLDSYEAKLLPNIKVGKPRNMNNECNKNSLLVSKVLTRAPDVPTSTVNTAAQLFDPTQTTNVTVGSLAMSTGLQSSTAPNVSFNNSPNIYHNVNSIARNRGNLREHVSESLTANNLHGSSVHTPNLQLTDTVPIPHALPDPASLHIVKQQLFQRASNPFEGEPQKYNAWFNGLKNKMAGLNMSHWDQLLVLEANTSKEPLKLVQKHMAIGGPDPSTTLNALLKELRSEFGSNVRIANALTLQVDSFPPIKSSYHTERMKELLYLCQYIEANMSQADELTVYNTAYGARRIWLKLPESLQNSWRAICDDFRIANDDRYPDFSRFVSFLAKKTREFNDPLLQHHSYFTETKKKDQRITLKTFTDNSSVVSNDSYVENPASASYKTSTEPSPCILHENGSHSLNECRKFLNLKHIEKTNLLKRNGMCFLCFGRHLKSNCTSNVKCTICDENHLTSMHFNRETTHQTADNIDHNLCTKLCGNRHSSINCSKTLLIDVSMKGSNRKPLRCYAILDEQSTSSFADPKIAEFFGVSGPVSDYSLKTLSGSSTKTDGVTLRGLQVKGVGEKKRINLPSILTNRFIPNNKSEVATPRIVSAHPHLRHLAKHFSDLNDDADVLLLIGRDAGECMFTRCFGNKSPFAHHTALGWALVGNCCEPSASKEIVCVLKTSLHEHFERAQCFKSDNKWNLDIFAERTDDELPGVSQENDKFLRKISSEVHTNNEGHIILPLPFKLNDPVLPDNHSEVFCRTKNTLNRISKDSNKLDQCIQVMEKYYNAGHVEMVPAAELRPNRPGHAWWIPIFPVVHPKKGKVRLVFDSSASYHGTSLNDHLLQGPDINNKLKDVLIGFRDGFVGFSADVESMFHNFYVKPEDKDYIRFYWFRDNDSSKEICQFRANVHIFGNCSSPAVASFGLRYAADLNTSPEYVSQFISEQFYVDDGLSCTDTVDSAIQVLHDTRTVLQRHNIRLHKICSSDPKVVEAFPPSERASVSTVVKLEENSIHTALGLIWDTVSDLIIIRTEIPDRPFTRRGVLATVNAVFDPLGISAPIVLEGKIIQRTILNSIPEPSQDTNIWDQELPIKHRASWDSWKTSLQGLSGLAISRCYRPKDFVVPYTVELHAFSDASTEGTGYVIYVRSRSAGGEYHVAFVAGNSKIAPKSSTTIPRLELCAALDVSQAASVISEKLCIDSSDVYLYTDSMITLGYLKNEERTFSRYVSRRVKLTLRPFPSTQWHYVSTDSNPADIASRQQSVQSLKNSCWLTGPDFLWRGSPCDLCEDLVELPETVPVVVVLKTAPGEDFWSDLFGKFSSYVRLINVTRAMLTISRAIADAARQRLGQSLAPRNTLSFSESVIILISQVQRSSFHELFEDSMSRPKGRFDNLSPFLDNNIVRVGGRLLLSDLEYNNKFPILLPNDHPFTTLLIKHHHERVRHQGRVITLSSIRESGYFIYQASSTIRKFINNCITCIRLRNRMSHQLMSNLPKDRLECVPPFTNSGMDVFGPYVITEGANTRRSTSSKKCWAVIFTCLNSRATHVEPLPYLDTPTMKNAIRRFLCLRGSCKRFRSDNGTNFIGVKNQELSISISEIQKDIEAQNCVWELTPPKASHFGGVWERQIQSIKNILKTCLHQLGNKQLSRDDFYTYLQECACILNNTPLWEYSSNPDDPRPLTPAMLLNLRCDTPTSHESFGEKDLMAYGSKRWRRVQHLSDLFWYRWRTDYLQTLQSRRKWMTPTRSFQPGDVVLLRDAHSKRYNWPIAKIVSVKKSHDGLVRSVNLVTASRNSSGLRELCRPVTELALLVPVDCSITNSQSPSGECSDE